MYILNGMLKMRKILLCLIMGTVLPSVHAGVAVNNAVYTGEDYSIYVSYTDAVYPGDAICAAMQFVPSRKTAREPAAETSAVLAFGESRKTDFFRVAPAKQPRQNAPVELCALLPVSTWQKPGTYTIDIMYRVYADDFMKFSLPVTVKEKEFISETLELNESNTAIKTDASPRRMQQIERLNDILFTVDPDALYQQGAFTPPTAANRRTAFFGDRRVYAYVNGISSTSLHYGIDYGVPTGTPVYACGTGKVVLAENRVSTGWSVVIEHMPGLYSLYYHLDSFSVAENQLVKQGEQIGVSGATGLATGPHLHWEIRLNGEAVNPDFFTGDFSFFHKPD